MEKKNLILGLIFLIVFIIYFPSLFNFFSHDDFFHLTISQARAFGDFLNFFNPTVAPGGFGFYRPLTTQVFYFLGISLFKLNPLPLHLISFTVFFAVIFMVFKLAEELLKSRKAALLTAFLYAVSATHFGHLYYLGAFQELGLAFFFFFSVWQFVRFLKFGKFRNYLISLVMFLGALMSKEFAVTLPAVLLLVFFHLKLRKEQITPLKKNLLGLVPFLLVLGLYLFFHLTYYGFAKGDSYVWQFSPRILNTIFWYLLWSFNMPEMLVDFVGPRLIPIPNLFKYYGEQILPILGIFAVLMGLLGWLILAEYRRLKFKSLAVYLFSIVWFVLTLAPVLFLPLHKFAYELTVPLCGFTLGLGLLLSRTKKYLTFSFLALFLLLSVLTLTLTARTHWITQGGKSAEKVLSYLRQTDFQEGRSVMVQFYDTPKDNSLPWKPSAQLKNILGNNNFFEVYYKGRLQAIYGDNNSNERPLLKVDARRFLNYD